MIYLAADHRGFRLKEELKKYFSKNTLSFEDVGALHYDQDDDYVDYARVASEKIAYNPREHKGIFICGSGHGMEIVGNKYRGVSSVLCNSKESAIQSREHGNTNVLVLAADYLDTSAAEDIVVAWLATTFSNEERHIRRLEKIKEIENKNFK